MQDDVCIRADSLAFTFEASACQGHILKKARARQSLSRKLKADHVLVTTRDNGGILRSSYTPVLTPLLGGGSTEGRCLDPSLCGQTFVPAFLETTLLSRAIYGNIGIIWG